MRGWFLMSPIFLIALLFMGCVQSDGSVRGLAPFKPGGKFLSDKPIEFSEEDIKARQNILRNITNVGDVPGKTEGTAVFEGEVLEKEYRDGLKAVKTKMAISTVVYGLPSGTVFLDLYTPLSKYGIEFEVGGKYRVGAVRQKLDYWWTWTWMGTFAY